ncbi:MAG TPA: hypothetical protein VLG11_04340 [Candidatus Saccharimonadales bacterium]|nr:hypothetical protein [Candidatus Saccharimonadales bacterium]
MRLRTKLIAGGAAAAALAVGMSEMQSAHPYSWELATQTDQALAGKSFSGVYMHEQSLARPATAAVIDAAAAQMEQRIQDGHNARNNALAYCAIAAENRLFDTPGDPLVPQIRVEATNYSFEHAGANQAPEKLANDCRTLDINALPNKQFAQYPMPL